MPVSSTTIHELFKPWVRVEVTMTDGRTARRKFKPDASVWTQWEGLPERDNPDYDPGPPEVGTPTLPAVPPDPNAFNSYLTQAGDMVLASFKQQDAEEGVDADTDIAANKEATQQEKAVAYLRRAWQEDDAYQAYRILDRFNTYRNAQGWTLDQVQANLAAAGLTVTEWDSIKTAYQYLSGGTRPADMAAHAVIQANWEARS